MTPRELNPAMRRVLNKGPRCKRAKLWQAARILREFTCEELAAVVEQPNVQSVRNYVCLLARVGYLRTTKAGSNAQPRRYRLVRNSGPLVPHFMRNHRIVYDPNTGEEFDYDNP